MEKTAIKTIAQNKKAWHDYFVDEHLEGGLELYGTEVKSIRQGKVNLKDSYCFVKDGEMFVRGMHVSPYEKGNIFNKDPLRERKVLLHKNEIMRLFAHIKQDGFSIIPISLYFKGSRVKMEIGICRGKKQHDKREDAARKDATKEMAVALKERNRS